MGLQWKRQARLRVLLIAAVVIGGLSILVWAIGRRRILPPAAVNVNQSIDSSETSAPAATPSSSPMFDPHPGASPTATPVQTPGPLHPGEIPATQATPLDVTPAGSFVGTLKLIVPVVGVRPDQLLDTFTDARSEGRPHDAIDIPAAAGTPVVAVAAGEVIKLFQSERGGTTIYQLSTDKKLVFYYAHLQGYANGLAAGKFVKQGEVIGYVGDTGNAGTGNFHLHFSISVVPASKRYGEGTNINPYPLLRK